MSLSLFLLHNKKVNSYSKMPHFLSFIDMKDLCLNFIHILLNYLLIDQEECID